MRLRERREDSGRMRSRERERLLNGNRREREGDVGYFGMNICMNMMK